MPKKTARTSKPGQQRSKEEQWRKRMAAQARVPAGSAVVETEETAYDEPERADTRYAPAGETAASRPRAAGTPAASANRTQAAAAAAQRRSASMARSARLRPGANVLSVDEEMRYIKGDIRKLVILTSICII